MSQIFPDMNAYDLTCKVYAPAITPFKRLRTARRIFIRPIRQIYVNYLLTGSVIQSEGKHHRLQELFKIVSGKSYFDYVRENIHVPVGMVNTDCYELDKVNTNLAVGYDKVFSDNGIAWRNNIFDHVMRGGPQGGGYSTAEDLLKCDQALRSGKLVNADTLKLLTTPKLELNSPNYGYGFTANPAMKTTGHSGGFTGINSDLRMDLSGGWTIIVMSNYSRAAGPVSVKIAALVRLPN